LANRFSQIGENWLENLRQEDVPMLALDAKKGKRGAGTSLTSSEHWEMRLCKKSGVMSCEVSKSEERTRGLS
jgi:hypothetical protein